MVTQCTADHTNNNNQDGTGAGKQPPRCPQEEDEADEGGDGEVQGGERGHGEEAPSGDSPARGGEFATSANPAPTWPTVTKSSLQKFGSLRGNPLKLLVFAAGSCGTLLLWHQLLLPALDLGWDESEWDSGFEPVSGSSSSRDPRLRIVTWPTGGCTTPPPPPPPPLANTLIPPVLRRGSGHWGALTDAIVARPASKLLSLSSQQFWTTLSG